MIAKKLAGGQDHVRLFLDAQTGHSAEIAERVRAISGEVLLLATDIDFLRVSVPIARLGDIQRWPELTTWRVEMSDVYASRFGVETSASDAAMKPGPKPTAYTARDNPYTGEAATESLQFKTTHPTFDGRDAVIGLIEPVDARTPSLAWAISRDGARVPKLLDYVMLPPKEVTEDPATANEQTAGFGWQRTARVWPDDRGLFTFGGQTYSVPKDARSDEWRVTRFHVRQANLSPELTVFWNVRTATVSLCEAGQTAFADGVILPLPTSIHRAAIGTMRHDEKRTVRIAVDLPDRTLGLEVNWSEHGTMCASVASGHSFLNSQAEGVAPGARLMVIDYRHQDDGDVIPTLPLHAWLELLRDPRVDVISNSTAFFSGREHLLDSRRLDLQLLDRLLTKYPKPFFVAAGNYGPETGALNEGVMASDQVITIGAYTPAETWQANFGITPTAPFTPAPYSAYGPTEDGALKPDLLSLTGTLSSLTVRAEYKEVFDSPYVELPTGYAISGGTSAAAPNASGHGALLVSAAKQAGLPHDPARLKVALFSTAKFLPGVEARLQGHGLIQVAGAWEALRRLARETPPTFVTRAPVRTFYSEQFATPNIGRGLHERVGWSPGQSGDRELTITRTSGPATPISYMLHWQGDVDTFSSPLKKLTVPLNQPVKLPVHIHVGPSRAYSAIVDLIDPQIGLVMHSVLCTVIAAEPLSSANGYSATIDGTAPRPGHGFAFVNVPPGTTALRVQATQRHGRHAVLFALAPDGELPQAGVTTNGDGTSYALPWKLPSSNRETYDQTFVHPLPGVWQLWITHDDGFSPKKYDPDETRPAAASDFTMHVTALGLDSSSTTTEPASAATVNFVNRLGTVERATVQAMGVGTLREDRMTLPAGFAPVFHELDVPEGASRLEAAADADSSANISLAVFRIDDADARIARLLVHDASPGARKFLTLMKPAAGKYKVCVDAWGDVPERGVSVRYRDVLYHPLYGTLHVNDTAATLAAGEHHPASISWAVNAWPIGNRQLVGEVGLFGESYVNMSTVTERVPIATQIFSLEKPGTHVPDPSRTAGSSSDRDQMTMPRHP